MTLINFGNEINKIISAYTAKLDCEKQKIDKNI